MPNTGGHPRSSKKADSQESSTVVHLDGYSTHPALSEQGYAPVNTLHVAAYCKLLEAPCVLPTQERAHNFGSHLQQLWRQ